MQNRVVAVPAMSVIVGSTHQDRFSSPTAAMQRKRCTAFPVAMPAVWITVTLRWRIAA